MDLSNKLCVVTGANSGIGKETVRAFARRGAYIIMVCRNEQRANQARQDIVEDTNHAGLEIILADLALQYDIRKAAATITDKFDHIDILSWLTMPVLSLISAKKRLTVSKRRWLSITLLPFSSRIYCSIIFGPQLRPEW